MRLVWHAPPASRFCLSNARVVFCTVAKAGSRQLSSVRLRVVSAIVDEAAQVPEAELSILLAGWPGMRQLLLVSC